MSKIIVVGSGTVDTQRNNKRYIEKKSIVSNRYDPDTVGFSHLQFRFVNSVPKILMSNILEDQLLKVSIG